MNIKGVATQIWLKAKQEVAYGFFLSYVLAGITLLVVEPVYANPTGGNVVAGQATITETPGLTQINQGSDKAILNWQSFNIGATEKTQFIQPSASSIALNRVIGQDPSKIFGQLSANGQVILVNPSGILFGAGSRVDAAGLIATTANIRDDDFMAGQLHFTQAPDKHAAVINNGTIHIQENGLAALVAPAVQNNGVIEARLGRVTLGSGNEFTVDLHGDELINFNANHPVTQAALDEEGRPYEDAVSNRGAIYADGGKVHLTAHVAKGIVDNSINMQGVIQAQGVSVRNGEIILSSGNSGTVRVSGKLNVSTHYPQQRGGTVKVLAENIFLTKDARIDASGSGGGGEVLIGGNYQGLGPERNAQTTTLEKGALINASATVQGNGGKVVIWSDGMTDFDGAVLATGGTEGGNGGFTEVSGKQVLAYKGEVDLRAPLGETGTLLLDPEDLTIQTAGTTTATASGSPTNTYTSSSNSSILTVSDLQNALANASVTVLTRSTGSANGDIFVNNNITWGSSNTLTLSAYRNIVLHGSISINAGGNLVLQADSSGTGIGTISNNVALSPAAITLNSSSTMKTYYNPAVFGTPTNFVTSNVFNVSGGTLTNYMLVNSATNLQAIGTGSNANGNYALGKDITVSPTIANFIPIDNFNGNFDGLNHSIIDLVINRGLFSLGFFGTTEVGTKTFENIRFVNPIINNTLANSIGTGVLAGEIDNTKLNNISVIGGSVTGHSAVGGLIGTYSGLGFLSSDNVATNLSISGLAITATNVGLGANNITDIGGVVGILGGASLTNVYFNGTLSVFSTVNTVPISNIGGIAGRLQGSNTQINTAYSTGLTNVTNGFYIGGLVGNQVNGPISNSSTTMAIAQSGCNCIVGGLVGISKDVVTNSFSAASLSVTDPSVVGGFIGDATNSTVSNSFWNTDLFTRGFYINPASATNVSGKTTAQLMTQSTFTGWDFTPVTGKWGILAGVSYPYLLNIFSSTPQVVSGTAYADNGSTVLSNLSQVKLVSAGSQVGAAYVQSNGFYYLILPNNTLSTNTPVLAYLNSGANIGVGGGYSGGTVFTTNNTANSSTTTGTNLYNNTLRVGSSTGLVLSTSSLNTLKGALTDSDMLYSISGNDLTINGGKTFAPYSAYVINGNLTGNGNFDFTSDVTLSNAAILNAGSGNITFGTNSRLNSAYDLTLASTGSISFTGTTGNPTPLNTLGNMTITANILSGNGISTLGTLSLTGRNGLFVSDIHANALYMGGQNGGRLFGVVTYPPTSRASLLANSRGAFFFNGRALDVTENQGGNMVYATASMWGMQTSTWINRMHQQDELASIRANFDAIDKILARSYFYQEPLDVIFHSEDNIELLSLVFNNINA